MALSKKAIRGLGVENNIIRIENTTDISKHKLEYLSVLTIGTTWI